MRYFSKSKNGFFTSEINDGNIPNDAVEVTDEKWQLLIEGQLNGKIIAAGEDGHPYVSDPPPLTTEELTKQMREQRDKLLSEMDVIISNPLRWNNFSQEKQQQYSLYRQALLNVPQQIGFPSNIEWPTLPE